jgi:hypothetical protein
MTSPDPEDDNLQEEISDEQPQAEPQMTEEVKMTLTANSFVGLPKVPDPK